MLLFLDEPTAGLDPIGAAHYDELVKGLNKSLGVTILMVTHDLDSLYAACDRIAVLLDKRVVVGTIDELLEFDHPWVQEYFHGPRGRAAARQAGVERRQMERRSPYVLIGAAMILFIAAVAGFVIWKLRAGDRTAYAYYDILFSGDVQGLTTDSPVFYRGLRVGRVSSIQLTSRVDTQRSTGRERLSEKIEVTVAVDWNIDIRERSYAVFEKPFIAGAPFIQIVGRLDVDQIKPKKKAGRQALPRDPRGRVVPAGDLDLGAGAADEGRRHGRPPERAAEPRQCRRGQPIRCATSRR